LPYGFAYANLRCVSEATDLLTAAEVAERFRVSVQTVYRWGKDGTLPGAVTLGGVRRFRREDVDRLLSGDAA
jgi:excisionase family DNA binding protein